MIIDKPTVHTSLYSDGPISGTSFVKLSGTSEQFLKADGSVSTGTGGGIIMKEIDGTPTISGVTTLSVTNGTLTDNGGGEATLTITGGGASALSGLTDTTITSIASGELIKWNGTNWVNNTLSEAGIVDTINTQSVGGAKTFTVATQFSNGINLDTTRLRRTGDIFEIDDSLSSLGMRIDLSTQVVSCDATVASIEAGGNGALITRGYADINYSGGTGGSSTISGSTDTTISVTPSDNQALSWDTATSKWIPQTLASATSNSQETVIKDGGNVFNIDFSSDNNFLLNATGVFSLSVTISASEVGQSGNIIINNTGATTPAALPSNLLTSNGAALAWDTTSGSVSLISYYVFSSTEAIVNYIGNFS